jgi:DNA-binding response OmpR family regulator
LGGGKMSTILLVDDEERMLDLLSLHLKPYNYECIKSTSGYEALRLIKKNQIDLVILDVMMPEIDGWTTCQKIREISDVPVIMLTARSETEDVITGLKNGADDYITKPFNEAELLARIEALLRRISNHNDTFISYKGLKWDENSIEVKFENHPVLITPKEFSLIGLFLKNPHKVFTRDHLLSTIWGHHSCIDDRTVDSHIRNIRDKLRQAGFPIDNHLKTVWGVGYKWVTH